ncbi:MAG: emp24/gp25L/p24 family protein [candidate division WOR-3 bacterium]
MRWIIRSLKIKISIIGTLIFIYGISEGLSLNPKAQIVADITFSISPGEEKEFYYKFAEGDTIIFNAWVGSGNDISEVSIKKYPSSVIFSSMATRTVENKSIFVEKNAVYVFSFKNTSLFNQKVYKFTIHRIPTKEEFQNFNTSVEWETIYDTTYVTRIESVLIKVDTIVEEVVNTQTKIGAQSTSTIKVILPEGTLHWAYWIGVGQEAIEGLKRMGQELSQVGAIVGDPVTAFALGMVPSLFTLHQGLDISYSFEQYKGGEWVSFKRGSRVVTDYAKMEYPKSGVFYIRLDNSYSVFTSKLVAVKVVAVRLIPQYDIRQVKEPNITIRKVPRLD